MTINPVLENEAKGKVKEIYQTINKALETNSIPLFFAYFGNFPDYLDYLSPQLLENLFNSNFAKLAISFAESNERKIALTLRKSEEIGEFVSRFQFSPSFVYFQQDLKKIFLVNIKLTLIFLGLRESVKGYAVAAQKIAAAAAKENLGKITKELNDEFIFSEIVSVKKGKTEKTITSIKKSALVKFGPQGLEKSLLPDYLTLCRNQFFKEMKRPEFWDLRLKMEEEMLAAIDNLPHFLHSPINIMLQFAEKYKNFHEFIYLLAENFPTLAMQRLLFSGFMKV